VPNERYTTEEVLGVLWATYPWKTSDDPSDTFADMRLDEYDDWCLVSRYTRAFLGFFKNLEDMFCFKATEEEWLPLAKKKTTMRELAQFIAERAPRREIRPLRILGRDCLSAGIFRQIQQVVSHVLRNDTGTAPSTPLRNALTKSQRERLRLCLYPLFPKLGADSKLWHHSLLDTLTFVSFWGIVAATLLGGLLTAIPESWSIGPLLVVLGGFITFAGLLLIPVFILMLVTSGLVNRNRGPFNLRIRTFRDLVMALQDHLGRSGGAHTQPVTPKPAGASSDP
jgi:hypothetical protein